MVKAPSFQFYPADWLNDIKLQACSLQAQGLLVNLMCLMHQSERYGYLLINGQRPSNKTLNKLLRLHYKTLQSSLKELLIYGVIKEDKNKVLFCERMVKDEQIRQVRRDAGKLGGNPLLKQKVNQKNNQKTTPSSSSSVSSSKINNTDFDKFWEAYPKKRAKGTALKTWNKLKTKRPRLFVILGAIKVFKRSPEWQKDGGQYIPYPSTWLNGECWEDEILYKLTQTPEESHGFPVCPHCKRNASSIHKGRKCPFCDKIV